MEASATLALVISNIHSAILKVTSKLEWAVGQINDNQRRLNNLSDLTTVSSEDNRLAIERLIAEVDSLKAENEGLRESMQKGDRLVMDHISDTVDGFNRCCLARHEEVKEDLKDLNLSVLAREDEMKDDILFLTRRADDLSKEVQKPCVAARKSHA